MSAPHAGLLNDPLAFKPRKEMFTDSALSQAFQEKDQT